MKVLKMTEQTSFFRSVSILLNEFLDPIKPTLPFCTHL
jgi:hypothetical protein